MSCVVAALVLMACGPEPRRIPLELRVSHALGCAPTALDEVRISPLGDFPAADRPAVRVDLEGGVQSIDLFSPDTERLSVDAAGRFEVGPRIDPWGGGALVTLAEPGPHVAPILRFRRSCALADTTPRVLPGAVAIALSDGRFLTAGGELDGAGVQRTVTTLRPGDALARSSAATDLFIPRAFATATEVAPGLVLFAGGFSGAPLDSYELVRMVEPARRLDGDFLIVARYRHGAARLADGSVLLVGGLGPEPLASAERLTISADGSSRSSATTIGAPRARFDVQVMVLDDGSVWVVGGRDEAGPLGAIERYDPGAEIFTDVASFGEPRAQSAYVALSGARIVRVGGRADGGAWSGDLDVFLVATGEVLTVADAFEPLAEPAAVALGDGTILIEGADPAGGPALARRVDPGASREPFEAREPEIIASRAATHLVRLGDGSVAEGDADGLSLLRLDNGSLFDALPASLFVGQPADREAIALDIAAHWTVDGDLLVATVDGARIELPRVRYAELSIDIDVEVPASARLDILLTAETAAPARVEVGPTAARVDDCAIAYPAQERIRLHLERRGNIVTIEADGLSASCSVDLPPRVGLAFVARGGAGLRQLAAARL